VERCPWTQMACDAHGPGNCDCHFGPRQQPCRRANWVGKIGLCRISGSKLIFWRCAVSDHDSYLLCKFLMAGKAYPVDPGTVVIILVKGPACGAARPRPFRGGTATAQVKRLNARRGPLVKTAKFPMNELREARKQVCSRQKGAPSAERGPVLVGRRARRTWNRHHPKNTPYA